MKKIFIEALLIFAIVLSGMQLEAQKLSKKFSFGIGIEGGLVTGVFKDTYGANGGLTLRGSYHAGPGFVTLTSGAIGQIPKTLDGEDLKAALLIPVRAGYKYIFKDHFFAMGEIGYGSLRTFYTDENDDLQSETSGGFLYCPSVGVQFGTTEISLRYESVNVDKAVTLSNIALRLGFNF